MPVRSSRRVPDDVADLASAVLQRLTSALGNDLHGLYLSGSIALGAYHPESSDIDLFGVIGDGHSDEKKREIVDALLHPPLDIPSRGLELVLFEVAGDGRVPAKGDFALNLNVGPDMPLHVTFDPQLEPGHWFVLDRSIVREHGLSVFGPPPSRVFADIPRPHLLKALHESLVWHEGHEVGGVNAVLNACRALRFVREGVWSSKESAATWAMSEGEDPQLIDAATTLRGQRKSRLDLPSTKRFLDRVSEEIKHRLE